MENVSYRAASKGQGGLMGRREIERCEELPAELPPGKTDQQEQVDKGQEPTLKPATLRRQVNAALNNIGEDWASVSRAVAEIEQLAEIGKHCAEAGEWANAQLIYITVAEGIQFHYEDLPEDDDDFVKVLNMCTTGLVACLQAQSTRASQEHADSLTREKLLSTLFDLWIFNSHCGHITVDIVGAIAGATTQHRKETEARLREALRPGQDVSSKWHNRRFVDFLTVLKQAEHCSDDEILAEYRQVGLYTQLAEKYVQFGRQEEALAVAQANITEAEDVTDVAEQLMNSGQIWQDQALALVEIKLDGVRYALQDRLQDVASTQAAERYQRWLGENYLLCGKLQHALDIELARFQARPEYSTYCCVRTVATAAGQAEDCWPGLRPQLIRTLEGKGYWEALLNLYLDEKKVAQALAALAEQEHTAQSPRKVSLYNPGSDYQTRVAEAAEESYPDEALRLYRSVVQRLINARGRENYQQATVYLLRVKRLYQQQGQDAAWEIYIATLRGAHKKLRAFTEELDTKNLI